MQQDTLKARVDQILARNNRRNKGAIRPEIVRNNQPLSDSNLLRPKKADLPMLQRAVDSVSGEGQLLIVDDLLRALAAEDFEDEQLMSPSGLEALARCVQASMMRQNGQVPPGWTSITKCRRCGPV